jgi:hypothetical protein
MYLYIFEDGRNWQSENSPTPDELEAIGDGIMDAYSVVGGKFVRYNHDGKMEDVPDGPTSSS